MASRAKVGEKLVFERMVGLEIRVIPVGGVGRRGTGGRRKEEG